jgi:alpha-glucosidase
MVTAFGHPRSPGVAALPRRKPELPVSVILLPLLLSLPFPVRAQTAVRLAEGVVRFDRDSAARAQAVPSFSFEDQRRREVSGPVIDPAAWPVRPLFERTAEGGQQVRITLAPGTSLYGTGEVFGSLERTGTVVRTWNTDAFAYGSRNRSLYQSHPWVLAVGPDGRSLGLLADTSYRCDIDLTEGVRFSAPGPDYPLVVIEGEGPGQVLERLTDLVGRIPMPPLWALGYHQCRYSYAPEARVREIAAGFRERDIPCDVIWLDIDYMDGYRVFTFDPEGFPAPAALDRDLKDQGFHTVWMIDPGIKAEPGYAVYDSGSALDAWVVAADGSTPWQGKVWPGLCVFPDFTRGVVRAWWAGLYADFMAIGVDGVWNDMNEPAVFEVPSKTMPEDNLHRADPELGGPATHDRFHNVYGMLMVRATREGLLAARPDERPFVLSRANFLGGQRYAATWTGDNVADAGHLEASVPMVLNLGLSGQPFSGPDIGGFAGNGTPELFAEWIGVGALLPFARGHTAKGNIDKEPWAFGPEVETAGRLALQRRYRLLPYLYTLFHEAAETGQPIVRPLFFTDPADPALRTEDDAFLLGGDVLVIPPWAERDGTPTALSAGEWRPFEVVEGAGAVAALPQLRLRPGAILPVGPLMTYTSQQPLDLLTLIVNPGPDGQAEGVLYEDAGEGHAWLGGSYRLTSYRLLTVGEEWVLTATGREGNWGRPTRRLVVRVLLPGGDVLEAEGVDGQILRLRRPPTP